MFRKNALMHSIQLAYRMDENDCVNTLLPIATLPPDAILRIQGEARHLIQKVRDRRVGKGGLDAFMFQYDLSSEEGIALMCLAEALLRIPDSDTVDRLIKDKLTSADWEQHIGKSSSLFVNAATWALMLTGKVLEPEEQHPNSFVNILKRWAGRTGEPVIRLAVSEAMKILGRQFVMSRTIHGGIKRARKMEQKGYRYSYDMLGEAAKTAEDAAFYLQSYHKAIEAIGEASGELGPVAGPGVSVKLSALHPRYEWVNHDRVFAELLPRLKKLALEAKVRNIGLTIDAEEADRLEISLQLIEALASDPLLKGWKGLGLAVQAYQKRASAVVDWLIDLAKREDCRLMIRLVKGAYWDSEIKWTQEKGLKNYPVFTRKSSTDVCYLACAKKLLAAVPDIYPQFATHNAYTVAAILEMAGDSKQFEFQCLHGMGDTLFDNIVGKEHLNRPCRVYAPVGGHEYLLAYLVRRLLENGANTSFVNRIIDAQTPIEELIVDPVEKTKAIYSIPHPKIPLPIDLYGKIGETAEARLNSLGLDLSNILETEPLLQAVINQLPEIASQKVNPLNKEEVEYAIYKAQQAFASWTNQPIETRAYYLDKAADILEHHRPRLMALLMTEGGKTISDAVAEIREAVDFCRYYSVRLREDFKPAVLLGPTGEHNQLTLHGRGVIACISPWNFPLAIFLGQITAALAAGNTVVAKPASQTPKIALFAVSLLHQAGIPTDVVQCLVGKGNVVGTSLIEDQRIKGVMFTGSTETARGINQTLAHRSGPIVPFIAETGGQNAMIVDSSALAEQVVTDVLTSAFGSAGQRCSALRVLFLQEDVADRMIKMLKGAMAELSVNDPLLVSTDIGPVIDESARQDLLQHVEYLNMLCETGEASLVYECALAANIPDLSFFAPRAYEIKHMALLSQEVFGPILHVIRYKSSELDFVIDSINNTGFGLTLGVHSRITQTIDYIHQRLRVGNMYVNRSMIGAVVGVQPFGGEGLSGTGPKAGGPRILERLATERSLSINTSASGGNLALMSLVD
jgi:RHH-type proline utilization regulon transcriptional repressor/proline dehydrogenase/delta 1-pyrroline-5-carboxylate dehydrogenase